MTAPPLKNTVRCQDNFTSPGGVFAIPFQAVGAGALGTARYLFKSPPFWIPLLLLGVATLIFRFTDADLAISGLFYGNGDTGSAWPMAESQPWLSLYQYGIYPAWILGAGGLVVWLLAFLWKRVQPIRDEGLFFAAMLFLGPGILVNGISKPYCGRPRPHLVKDFGGDKDFLPVLKTGENVEGDCNSFPSGHAAMGFYLMAPAFVLYGRRNDWAAAILVFGLAAGCTIGLARIAAGAHFASDVLWAWAFVYFTGLVVLVPFRFAPRGKFSGRGKL
jgi:lipid A 4'-phosphatase